MELKKFLPSVIIVMAIVAAFFAYSKHNNLTSPAHSTLRQELLATENSIPTEAGKKNFLKQSNNLTKRVDAELVDLDSQIISCDANVDGLASGVGTMSGSCIDSNLISAQSVQGKFMGGQCCSALMDTKEYHENLGKLQAYKSMPNIPLDPMHTPIELAKKWIDYDKATTLTPTEQKIFDEAYTISKEKPCCCKCWHYYTNEGIAKKMIKDSVFSARQIAAYWDASDICGA
ncbi:MAG: hypothetical protein M1334_00295 [Patescibacteria group bacterium]|nr:hypothetical protein [Patescibacteria group bacterium]